MGQASISEPVEINGEVFVKVKECQQDKAAVYLLFLDTVLLSLKKSNFRKVCLWEDSASFNLSQECGIEAYHGLSFLQSMIR